VRAWEHQVFMNPDEVISAVAAALEGCPPVVADSWRVVQVDPLPEGDDMERRLLVDLHDATRQQVEVRKRTTGKWPRKPVTG